jgi:hypothetical protein
VLWIGCGQFLDRFDRRSETFTQMIRRLLYKTSTRIALAACGSRQARACIA